ncbi:MAG: methylmalonyl Co-A mutase-associated GTPase MeaB [Myxococcales bacterium]|nr:methylmalonyl Co-A mutase-associated GTPase MeaB [Myxococcales bacterium]
MYNGPSIDLLTKGVLNGERPLLARAITLVESTHPYHRELANRLLSQLRPHAGQAHRVGITGVPGAGKSTFIETLGLRLVGAQHRVAVLAVDPSSTRSGGSILADKTRMTKLGQCQEAFVRPSPSRANLGGVTRVTRETITIVEAAGFDVVLVETLGVGQSEIMVADMVDFFLVLMIAGAGDEFQGIKKGILELADLVAINKADGDNTQRAHQAAAAYQSALRLLAPVHPDWHPPVMTCSAITGDGIEELWSQVLRHQQQSLNNGEWQARRQRQQLRGVWSMVSDTLLHKFHNHPKVKITTETIEAEVLSGSLSPSEAVQRLLTAFES